MLTLRIRTVLRTQAETHSRLVEEWHELIEQRGPEVLLCVGVCEHQAPDEFEPAEHIQGWCVENDYEHVALGEWTHASLGVHALFTFRCAKAWAC